MAWSISFNLGLTFGRKILLVLKFVVIDLENYPFLVYLPDPFRSHVWLLYLSGSGVN